MSRWVVWTRAFRPESCRTLLLVRVTWFGGGENRYRLQRVWWDADHRFPGSTVSECEVGAGGVFVMYLMRKSHATSVKLEDIRTKHYPN